MSGVLRSCRISYRHNDRYALSSDISMDIRLIDRKRLTCSNGCNQNMRTVPARPQTKKPGRAARALQRFESWRQFISSRVRACKRLGDAGLERLRRLKHHFLAERCEFLGLRG